MHSLEISKNLTHLVVILKYLFKIKIEELIMTVLNCRFFKALIRLKRAKYAIKKLWLNCTPSVETNINNNNNNKTYESF